MMHRSAMLASAGLALVCSEPAWAETPIYHWVTADAPPANAVYATGSSSTNFAFCAFLDKRRDGEGSQWLSGYFNRGRCNTVIVYSGNHLVVESQGPVDFLVVDAGAPGGTWADCLNPGRPHDPSSEDACKVPDGHVVDRRFRWPVTVCSFAGTAHLMAVDGGMRGFGEDTATNCRPTQRAYWRQTKVLIGEIR